MRRGAAIKFAFNFRSHGVNVGIETETAAQLRKVKQRLAKIFPGGFEEIAPEKVVYQFEINSGADKTIRCRRNEEVVTESRAADENFYEAVQREIRLTVAEFAVGKVFLHAGVVAWKNRAIVIPAISGSGKTTLVVELLKKGAVYYSDEYAVLNSDGWVEPFPKWLSIRGIKNAYTQVDRSVESLGAVAGQTAVPVGLILLAGFDEKKSSRKNWKPKVLSPGQAMMEILPHTLPIRNNPKFVLEVLNKSICHAIIVKTIRGEAEDFAQALLNYLEQTTT